MLLLLFLLLGAFENIWAQKLAPVAAFRLYTAFETEPPEAVRSAMKEELDDIMEPIGWQIDWSPLNPSTVGKISVSIAVVHFRGTCDVAELRRGRRYADVLGSADVAKGRVLPYAYVECDAIRTLLKRVLVSMDPGNRAAALGRAMGRVLAHELYHVLTGESRHAPTGLAEPSFACWELSGRKLRFAPEQVQKLRRSLVPVLMSVNYPPENQREGAALFVTSGCAGCHGPTGEGTRWGPSLKNTEHLDAVGLRARLTDNYSEMYSRAKKLDILWPHLNARQMESLSAYLNRSIR